jgi:hypothetical protein
MTLDDLLKKTETQLDELFGNAQPGPIPEGDGEGRAIIAPGSTLTDEIADLLKLFAWQGKVFTRDENDPEKGELRNKILPFGLKLIVAKVYKGNSWFDDKPCIVLDYSKSSLLARKIRDEIREIEPGLYLGKVYWGDREPGEKALIHFALKF